MCADATSCKVFCKTTADCTIGECNFEGKCLPGSDAGPLDAGSEEVGPSSDAGIPKDGQPPKISGPFQRCTLASECASGFCVEGVCCNTACSKKCHSCTLLSSPGVCVPEPMGVDLRGECGAPGTCIGTCNGGGACVGAGPDTLCARNRCTGRTSGVGAAFCASAGTRCPTDGVVKFDCAPYACDSAFGACKTTCVTSEDCGPGNVCESATQHCVPATAPEAASDGCSQGPIAVHSTRSWLLALSALAGLALRRRRRER